MRGRHWERLSSAMGTRVHPGSDGEINLQKLLSVGITQHAELLQVGCSPDTRTSSGLQAPTHTILRA